MSKPKIDYEIDTTKMTFSLGTFRISNILVIFSV
jgi:hypothetical protein